MVEIIRVALALILQLVEEVEDIETERRRRPFNRRRKPAGTEELDIIRNGAIAIAVTDNEAVNAR